MIEQNKQFKKFKLEMQQQTFCAFVKKQVKTFFEGVIFRAPEPHLGQVPTKLAPLFLRLTNSEITSTSLPSERSSIRSLSVSDIYIVFIPFLCSFEI
jgi:hypothetical protein